MGLIHFYKWDRESQLNDQTGFVTDVFSHWTMSHRFRCTRFLISFWIRSNRHSSEIYRQNVNKIYLNSLDKATPAMNKHTTNRFIFKTLGFRMKSNILNGDVMTALMRSKIKMNFRFYIDQPNWSVPCVFSNYGPNDRVLTLFMNPSSKFPKSKFTNSLYVYRFLVPFLSSLCLAMQWRCFSFSFVSQRQRLC